LENWIQVSKDIQTNRELQAEKAINLLGNDLHVITPSGDETPEIAPNHLLASIRRFVPSIYFADPYIRALAQRPTSLKDRSIEDMARGVEAVDSYMWKQTRAKKVMRKAIMHPFGYGFASVKVGLDRIGATSQQNEELEAEVELLLEGQFVQAEEGQDHRLHIETKEPLLNSNDLPELARTSLDMVSLAIEDNINQHRSFIERENEESRFALTAGQNRTLDWLYFHNVTRNVFWEPGAMDPLESAFIVHRYLARVRDVKNDPFYENTADLQGSPMDPFTRKLMSREGATPEILEDLGYIWLNDVWDAETRTLTTKVDDNEKLLRDEDPDPWPSTIESYPFRFLTFMDGFEGPHGEPLIDYMEWPQRLISRIYAQYMTHTESSGESWGFVENQFDEPWEDVLDKYMSGAPKTLYKIKQSENPPWVKMPLDAPDPALITMLSLAQQALTINSSPADTSAVTSADSATAASFAGSEINTLLRDNITVFEDFQSELLKVANGYLLAYGDDDITLRAAAPNSKGWVHFKQSDLLMEWDLKVKMMAPPSQVEKQEVLNTYAIIKDDATHEQKQYLIQEIVRMNGWDADQFAQEDDPEVIKLAQLENNMMRQGQPVPVDPKETHALHMKIHMPEAQNIQRQMQQMQGQANGQNFQQVQQAMQPLQTGLQAMQEHIQAHQQFMGPGQQQTRVRNQVPLPTGNPGRTQSIASAEQTGG
jgi:hypothetical protein